MRVTKIEIKDSDCGCILEVEHYNGNVDLFKRGNFHALLYKCLYGIDKETGEESQGLFTAINAMLGVESMGNPCIAIKLPPKNSSYYMRLQIAFDKEHGIYESRVTVKDIDLLGASSVMLSLTELETKLAESHSVSSKNYECAKSIARFQGLISRSKKELAVLEALECLREVVDSNYLEISQDTPSKQLKIAM